jgi:hypothetical protein
MKTSTMKKRNLRTCTSLTSFALTCVGALHLADVSLAQGADDCGSAQAIFGTGLFPFDNTGATTDGPGACAVGSDVWYLWTAPASGDFVYRTCGQVTIDSYLAVYDGAGCPPGPQLGCSDDACSVQSSIQFTAVSGNPYLLRAGGFAGAQGTGNIEIVQVLNGGADDCANAQVISGTGLFPWNNAGFTNDGPAACTLPNKDLWFSWDAPSTGPYVFSLCNQTVLDTVMVLYEGASCPPTIEVACVDDACDLQSEFLAQVNAGTTYLIRIGSYSSTATGAGYLDIHVDPCDATTMDDPLEDNDDCAGAVAVPEGSTPNLWVVKSDPDWYSVTVAAGGTVTLDVLFLHANGDIDIVLYADDCNTQLAFSNSIDDDEQIVWNNTSGTPKTYELNVYVYSGSASNCNVYDLVVTGSGDGLGSKYCTATDNSTGAPADLSASGSTSSSAGNLALQSAPVPNNYGIFFHGASQAQLPFGNGFQCAVNDIKRGSPVLAVGNIADYVYDNSTAAKDLGPYIGSTRNFQHWFRDPQAAGAFFNTSNAMSIIIVP